MRVRNRFRFFATASVLALLVGCSRNPPSAAIAAEVKHDQMIAAILTCGGAVFEYAGTDDPESRYDYSVRDGAEVLVSIGHRIGFKRLSQRLGLGDDGQWLVSQFEPKSYQLKHDANRTVVSAAYLLGQYARHYCIEHPFDTLNDAINNLVWQAHHWE